MGRSWQEAPSFQNHLLITERCSRCGWAACHLAGTGLQILHAQLWPGPGSWDFLRWRGSHHQTQFFWLLEPQMGVEVESLLIPDICLIFSSSCFKWFSVGFFKSTLGSSIPACQGNVMGFMLPILLSAFANPITNIRAASSPLPLTGKLVKG